MILESSEGGDEPDFAVRRGINLIHAVVSRVVQNKKGARELLFDDVEEVVEGHATNSFWRQVRAPPSC